MPIILIWNTLAAPREAQFKHWLSELSLAAGLIKSWLGKRLSEGGKIEAETRGFPIFRFYNLALTARITPRQHAALVTEPMPGLGGNMQAVADAWRLTDEWARRAREALLIENLMNVLREMTAGALASIERFATPSAAMFNPASARASDLIGLGALAFRSIGGGRQGLWEAGKRLERALRSPPTATAATAGAVAGASAAAAAGPVAGAAAGAMAEAALTATRTPAEGAALPLAMRLDEGLRYIAGAILILPALGALLIDMGRDLLLWIRQTVIDELFAIEQGVFDLRQNLLTGLHAGLNDFSRTAAEFLVLARDYALAHLGHWAQFGVAYLQGLSDGVSAFTAQLGTFWNGVNDLIQALMGYTQRLMAIDLGEVIHNVLVLIDDAIDYIDFNFYAIGSSPSGYDAPAQFPVSIGDLVLNEGHGSRARDHLALGASRLRDAIYGAEAVGLYSALGSYFSGMNLLGILSGVGQLLPRLNQAPLAARAQPVLRYSEEDEPDLVAAIVTPLRNGFTRSVTAATDAARRGAEGVTTGLVYMLDATAIRFRAAALDAVRLGSLQNFHNIVAGSETLVQQAFPDAAPGRPTGIEATGRAFATWIQGGFETIGAVVGGYLGFLLDEWRQHLDANADTPVAVTPTSPRILLERARLGRVHLEEMRIVAGSQTTDRDLATRVAAGFRTAVRDAYVAGENQLGGFRAGAAAAQQAAR